MTIELARDGDLEDEVQALVQERLLLAIHELRQPLVAALALAEAAASATGSPEVTRSYLQQIAEQIREASETAGDLLMPSPRSQTPETSPVVVGEVVDSVLQCVQLTWKGRLIREGHLDGATTTGSRALIRRSLLNVVENAVRAAGPRGRVSVTECLDGAWMRIVVEDDGPGFGRIPTGTGIGLAVTRTNLLALGGSLSIGVTSSLGGARVAISLPAQGSPPGDGGNGQAVG